MPAYVSCSIRRGVSRAKMLRFFKAKFLALPIKFI